LHRFSLLFVLSVSTREAQLELALLIGVYLGTPEFDIVKAEAKYLGQRHSGLDS
jgi:NADH:ubiquinone oxidoreductase subunit K